MDNEQVACFKLLACHDEERRMVATVCVDDRQVSVSASTAVVMLGMTHSFCGNR